MSILPQQTWYSLGVDPDLHACSWALLGSDLSLHCGVWHVTNKLKGADAVAAMIQNIELPLPQVELQNIQIVVVEGQTLVARPGARHRRPDNIIHLAQVAGAAAATLMRQCHCSRLLIPRPAEWKGQVPKDVHQARTYGRLGIQSEQASGYVLPADQAQRDSYAPGVRRAAWKHIGDAIGLAFHGLTRGPE